MRACRERSHRIRFGPVCNGRLPTTPTNPTSSVSVGDLLTSDNTHQQVQQSRCQQHQQGQLTDLQHIPQGQLADVRNIQHGPHTNNVQHKEFQTVPQELHTRLQYTTPNHQTRHPCNQPGEYLDSSPRIPEVDDRTFDRVRTWGLRFNDQMDPIDFIERVEELARSQRVPLDQVPFTLSESFSDRALAWWRNRRHEWLGWENFKQGFLKFFLPVNFWDDLEDTIRRRQQREDEPFQDFALALETLMRHTHYDALTKLERIYKNSLPALRLLVKRREFETLDELTDLVSHIEATRGPIGPKAPLTTSEVTRNLQPRFNNIPKNNPARVSITNNSQAVIPPRTTVEKPSTSTGVEYIKDPKNACHKCAQHGHTQAQCKNGQRYFCWVCGKIGVLTKDCCPRNDTRLNIVHAREAEATSERPALQLSTPEHGERNIQCKLTSKDQEFLAIVDTGSWHSYVHEKVIANLPTSVYVRRACKYSVLMATGSKDQVDSSLDMTLQYQGDIITHKFLVLKSCTNDFILGMDFVENVGATLTLGSKSSPLQIATQLGRLRTQGTISTTEGKSEQPTPEQPIRQEPGSIELVRSVHSQCETDQPDMVDVPDKSQTHEPVDISPEDWLTEQDVLDISFGWHLEDMSDWEDEVPALESPPQVTKPSKGPDRSFTPPSVVPEPEPDRSSTRDRWTPVIADYQAPDRRAGNQPVTVNMRGSTADDMRGRRGYSRYSRGMTRNGNNRTARRPYARGFRANARLPRDLPPFRPVEDFTAYTSTSQQGCSNTSTNQPTIPRAASAGSTTFNYEDRSTWPESLIRVVDDYRDRGRNGERFRKMDLLHYDNNIRYRLSVKRDGTVRVTMCGPRPPRQN